MQWYMFEFTKEDFDNGLVNSFKKESAELQLSLAGQIDIEEYKKLGLYALSVQPLPSRRYFMPPVTARYFASIINKYKGIACPSPTAQLNLIWGSSGSKGQ